MRANLYPYTRGGAWERGYTVICHRKLKYIYIICSISFTTQWGNAFNGTAVPLPMFKINMHNSKTTTFYLTANYGWTIIHSSSPKLVIYLGHRSRRVHTSVKLVQDEVPSSPSVGGCSHYLSSRQRYAWHEMAHVYSTNFAYTKISLSRINIM